MTANALTITLFLLSCAVPIALEAIKMTGRTRVVLAVAASTFIFVGALWSPISMNFPKVATFMASIAGSPASWFLLVFAIAAMLREWWSRRVMRASIKPTDLDRQPQPEAKIPNDVEAIIDCLERKLESLQKAHGITRTQIKDVREQQSKFLMRVRALGDRETMQRSQTAHHYVKNSPYNVITSMPPERYLGTWQFSESDLPGSDTAHRYKTFCIMRRTFDEVSVEMYPSGEGRLVRLSPSAILDS